MSDLPAPVPPALPATRPAASYARASLAPATLRAYQAGWQAFSEWCQLAGRTALPAAPETAAEHLASPATTLGRASLTKRLAAIGQYHRLAGQPFAATHPVIHHTLRGIHREHGRPARRSAALATPEIRRLVSACRIRSLADLRAGASPRAPSSCWRGADRVGWPRAMRERSSGRGGNLADVGPHLECTRPCGSIFTGGDVVAAEMEEVVDLVMGGEETLCLPSRLEALHLPLSSSRRLVRILGPVVQALVLAVLDTGHHLPLRGAVAGELVSNHDAGRPALPLQQLAQQALRRTLVAPALDQHVEHHPGLIHRAPEPVLYPGDLDSDLIEVPLVPGAGSFRRIRLANSWPNLSAHCRTVSWLTMIPRPPASPRPCAG